MTAEHDPKALQEFVDYSRSLHGILTDVLAYDRDAVEGAVARSLGWPKWPENGSFVVVVDELGCFNGPHPGVRVRAIIEDSSLVRFEPFVPNADS